MTKIISLSLTPEATGRLHDVIACFAKFGETLSLEATNDKVSDGVMNESIVYHLSHVPCQAITRDPQHLQDSLRIVHV